jgi:thermostable 8-oxoguanine DNA glycosylase
MDMHNHIEYHKAPMFTATTEVVPGVAFGRPEWVPSPAFWLTLAAQEWTDDDRYVSRPGSPLLDDVAFCILGGFGISMEVNQAAFERLKEASALNPPSDARTIEDLLLEPLDVNGRPVRYRFPRQRAARLAEALHRLKGIPAGDLSPLDLRDALMELPGIGPKTASWIVRNWTGSDAVAILDVHVIRAGQIMGLFPKTVSLPRDYAVLERRFLDFAAALRVPASYLDALIWREMRILTT